MCPLFLYNIMNATESITEQELKYLIFWRPLFLYIFICSIFLLPTNRSFIHFLQNLYDIVMRFRAPRMTV